MPYTNDLNQNQSKEGVETHTRKQSQQQHAHKSRKEHKKKTIESQLKNMLKSLCNELIAWSRSLKVVECSKCTFLLLHGP
jgi:hypothetical protein